VSLQQQEYFSLSTRRHVFEGVAFGLQQATLFCQVTVASLSDQQLAHLDTHFDLFLKENAPELAPDCDNAERFVRRLIFWQSAIQRQSGIPVSERYWISPEPESAADTRVFTTAIPVVRGKASLRALTWVKSAVNEAFSKYASQQPDEEELQQTLDRINIELNNYSEPGINQHLIIMAANRLDIPVTRMSRRVILLGTGRYTRWFESTITDKTSPIGANIARNKEFTASLLRLMGLPGARQIRVSSAEEATEAAVRLGYPVVVKPADQDRGIGVNADLRNEASVIGAYQEARAASDHILVEKFCNGFTHRLTVVEDEVVRVTRRIAGGVVGDGKHSVAELVTLWNQDEENQRRSRRLGKVLLSLDAEARDLLAQQEVDESFIPEAEQYIRLRRRDNINTGGTNEHLQPDAIHPDNLRLAIDAARILGLDCAGVDLIIDDIQKSWQETEALICELNAKP
jgi:cyanophycin synthetase